MKLLAKYAPTTIDDFVFEDPTVEALTRAFASGARRDNILLHGDYGGGKSTLARLVANSEFIQVGSSQKAEVIMPSTFNPGSYNLIENSWTLGAIEGVLFPYVIVEDIDRLKDDQLDVRDFLDKHPNYGVIFTTNNLGLVDAGLLNRCQQIEVKLPSPKQWAPRAKAILEQEGVSVEQESVEALLTAADGSIRDIERALSQLLTTRN